MDHRNINCRRLKRCQQCGDQTQVAVSGQLNTIVWGYDNGNNYVYMRGIEVDFDDGNGYQLLEDGAGSPAGVNGFHLNFPTTVTTMRWGMTKQLPHHH